MRMWKGKILIIVRNIFIGERISVIRRKIRTLHFFWIIKREVNIWKPPLSRQKRRIRWKWLPKLWLGRSSKKIPHSLCGFQCLNRIIHIRYQSLISQCFLRKRYRQLWLAGTIYLKKEISMRFWRNWKIQPARTWQKIFLVCVEII